jgi:hypothetical protein
MKNFKVQPLVIEVRPSKIIKGEIGLFAVRSLPKGTVIAQADKMGEHFVPWSKYKSLDKKTQVKVQQFCLQTPDGFFAPDDLNYLSTPWNMNHSCSYNIGFDRKGNFITSRAVKSNEELVFDYGLATSNPDFKLFCKCKSKNCRKVITGNDWLNDLYVRKNKEYMLRDLLALRKQKGLS